MAALLPMRSTLPSPLVVFVSVSVPPLNVTPEDKARAPAVPLSVSVPLLMVVMPVLGLLAVSVSEPTPVFVKAPLVAVEAPVTVRVLVVMSKVAVLSALIVKLRSVLTLPPVYCRAPPSKTRFAAALADVPMLLSEPPLARVVRLRTPPLIVVAPV